MVKIARVVWSNFSPTASYKEYNYDGGRRIQGYFYTTIPVRISSIEFMIRTPRFWAPSLIDINTNNSTTNGKGRMASVTGSIGNAEDLDTETNSWMWYEQSVILAVEAREECTSQ